MKAVKCRLKYQQESEHREGSRVEEVEIELRPVTGRTNGLLVFQPNISTHSQHVIMHINYSL